MKLPRLDPAVIARHKAEMERNRLTQMADQHRGDYAAWVLLGREMGIVNNADLVVAADDPIVRMRIAGIVVDTWAAQIRWCPNWTFRLSQVRLQGRFLASLEPHPELGGHFAWPGGVQRRVASGGR